MNTQSTTPRTDKPCYILGRNTIERVADDSQLETEQVDFVAASDLYHQNPYKELAEANRKLEQLCATALSCGLSFEVTEHTAGVQKIWKNERAELSERKLKVATEALEEVIAYCEGDITYTVTDIRHVKAISKQALATINPKGAGK